MTSKSYGIDNKRFSKAAVLGGAALAFVTLLSATAFAGSYKYSPDNPYPPPDKAAIEYMKGGYLTGNATTTGYYWVGPDGKPVHAKRKFDPLFFLTAMRSMFTEIASALQIDVASTK